MTSLQKRLSFGVAMMMAVLLTLGGLTVYPAIKSILLDQFDQALLAEVRALTAPVTPGSQGFSLRFTEQSAPEFRAESAAVFFEVRSADGALISKSPSMGAMALPFPAVVSSDPVFFEMTLPGSQAGRAVALRLSLSNGLIKDDAAFDLVFARGTHRLDRALRTVMTGLLAGGVVLLLATVVLVRKVTRAGLRPISDLACQVTKIDSRTLSGDISFKAGAEELVPIVDQLNSLLVRLRSSFEKERLFSANVAHELLTPVTELRALSENAIRWSNDPEATSRFAQDVLETSRQVERLVRVLLTLARSDCDDFAPEYSEVDLVQILKQLAVQNRNRIEARKLTMVLDLPGLLSIRSDRASCESIFQNLFENAIEHCSTGGNICCRHEHAAQSVFIFIENTNPGLTLQDIPKIWEPFWRKDPARSDRAHAGLGLALVKSLAHVAGFEITAALTAQGLVRMTVKIPDAKNP